MSDLERYEIAKAYVDKQLKTMKENGLKVKRVSELEYETMVRQVARSVKFAGHAKSATTSC
jgi:hypothetical protein